MIPDSKRRRLITTALLAAACPFGPAFGQSASKGGLPRVAYVWLYDIGPSAPYADAFRTRMGELGWIEGKTVATEYRDAKGKPEELARIMDELVRSKVDVIVAQCTPEAMAARKATSTIPIVVAAIGDPVALGLAASLARPGGNVTGVSSVMLPLSAKRMELLREIAPAVKQAAVIWNPVRPDNGPEVKMMQAAGKKVGIDLHSVPVHSREEVAVALDVIGTDGTQALLQTNDTLLTLESRSVVERAAKLKVPAVYDSRVFVDAGGLISYGPDLPQLHQRAAEYVDKILRGASPADLPFEQPSRFELVINKKAARQLGLTIPNSVLVRADQVIE